MRRSPETRLAKARHKMERHPYDKKNYLGFGLQDLAKNGDINE